MNLPVEIKNSYKRFLDTVFTDTELKELQSYEVTFVTPLGKPGAGKGTLLKNLSKGYVVQVIGTGDIFRNPHAANCFDGQQASDLQLLCTHYVSEQKKLLPDDITTKAFGRYVLSKLRAGELDPSNIIFADVYPRTIPQVDHAITLGTLHSVILFTLPDDISLQRQRKRATEIDRPDNGQEYARLKEYYDQTHPLVEMLKVSQDHLVYEIDASKDESVVLLQVVDAIGGLLVSKNK